METNDIILVVLSVILTTLSLYGVQYLSIISFITISLLTLIFIFKYKNQLKLMNIFSFLTAMLAFTIYQYGRMHIKDMELLAANHFSCTAGLMENAALMFSMGYGLCQIPSGYICEKYKKAGPIIAAIFSAVISFAIARIFTTSYIAVLFALLGSTCSVLNMVSGTAITDYFSYEWFSSLSVYGITFASLLNTTCLAPMLQGCSWTLHYQIIGGLFAVVAVLYAIFSHYSSEVVSNVTQTYQERPFSTQEIIGLFLYSALVVIPQYAMQAGIFKVVNGDAKLSNELFGLVFVMIPLLKNLNMKDEILMQYSSIIGIISALIFLFCPTSRILLLGSVVGFTIASASHGLPPTIVGDRVKNAGTLFGILNFGAMMVGCAGGQYLFKLLLNTNISRTTIGLIVTGIFGASFACTFLLNRSNV